MTATPLPAPALPDWRDVDRLAHDLVTLPERPLTPGERLSRWKLVKEAQRLRDALIATEELPELLASFQRARAEAHAFFPDEVPA